MTRAANGVSEEESGYLSPLQLQLFPGAEPSAAVEPEPEPSTAVAGGAPEPPAQPAVAAKPTSKSSIDVLAQIFDEATGLPDRLRALIPGRIGTVTLTDNRSTIVSAREDGNGLLAVRIQRCFAEAPDETLAAVATFLTSGRRSRARRRALAEIRDYFARHGPRPAVRRPRRVVLRPVGQVLDLREVRDQLNREHLGGELDVHITWGRAPSRRRRRGRSGFSVRLGTYYDRDNVVRIHRCLDRSDVPRYVVESVVYHEMLHAAVPPVMKNGRRHIHTPEFRRRERLFPDYQRAERWLDRNLKRLI